MHSETLNIASLLFFIFRKATSMSKYVDQIGLSRRLGSRMTENNEKAMCMSHFACLFKCIV